MKNLASIAKWMPIDAGASGAGRDDIVVPFDPDDHPAFDPQTWNFSTPKPNCFGYALNAPKEIDPGFSLSGAFRNADLLRPMPFEAFRNCVRVNLEKDGLIRVEDAGALYRPGHYMVALCFVDEETAGYRDYHFLRLDKNGRWSQINFGSRFVSWTDDADEPLLNPASASLGAVKFDAFYHVPKGGLNALPAAQSAADRRSISAPQP